MSSLSVKCPKSVQGGVNDRKSRSKHESVSAILDAAERVLKKHGYKGTTIERVAKSSGMSVSAVYRYFPNKAAIVTALFEKFSLVAFKTVRNGIYKDIVCDANKGFSDVTHYSSTPCLFDVYEKYSHILIDLPQQAKELEDVSEMLSLENLIYCQEIAYLECKDFDFSLSNCDLVLFLINNFWQESVRSYFCEGCEGASKIEVQRQIMKSVVAYVNEKKRF